MGVLAATVLMVLVTVALGGSILYLSLRKLSGGLAAPWTSLLLTRTAPITTATRKRHYHAGIVRIATAIVVVEVVEEVMVGNQKQQHQQ
jgi:hypothetical protein